MSQITKTICDNCQRELGNNEWYYQGRISENCNSSKNAALICDGDYCAGCFVDRIKSILGDE